MGWLSNFKDAVRRKKSRDFAQELSNQFFLSPICSDYENLFAQVRPLIDEMKVVFPYGVTDRGTKLPITKTPELAWLKNPNDEMGWAEFADIMFATWLTEDELDIHVWRTKTGKVEAYTIIPPECRIYLGYGRWEWQVLTTEGIKILEEDEVMRLRFSRSPRNIQKGVSPASAARVWAQIDDLIAQYQRAYFENGAIPATITFITASSKEKYESTRRELENKLKGARNHNKTIFAWRQFDNDTGQSVDQVEVKTIQGNNSTLAIKEIVDIVNDRLNKSVGVSNFLLGDDSSAKYDNAELSDHQFTKRRVYPALISFWNQFQHELERILGGGLGYGISFDLEIPELTERVKAKAEIGRIRSEALENLISAGASGDAAVDALGLPDSWRPAANGMYIKAISGGLNAPVNIDYSKPAAIEATVDKKAEDKSGLKDHACKNKCSCRHSLDALPEMTADEKKLYDLLIALADSIIDQDKESMKVEYVIERMVEILEEDARNGEKQGADALALLAEGDVANEILNTVSKGQYYVSETLKERISLRANRLVRGFDEYTKQLVEETLAGSESLSASQIKTKLAQIMPRTRAELIARNETLYAIRSGRLEQDESLAEKYGLNVELVWRTSGDNKVCPICAAMEGQTVELGKAFNDTVKTDDGEVLGWEHSVWNDNGRIPDAHVNCVLGDTKVLADGVKVATKMNYSGEVVKLSTKNGRSITTTPNHILLTTRGWVLAKNITKSDQVIAYSDRVKPFVGNNTIDGNIPTISEQFITASESDGVAARKMPATTKDFKGDGIKDEEIDVIFVDGLLSNKGNTSFDKLKRKLPFISGSIQDDSLSGISTLDQLLMGTLAASHGIIGSDCEALALLGS
ncbi:phage portal protein, partial [Fibrobacter sp.]|uniref:phage portal protein n=1 Tax=Fibrobacter sp. TaxID=35828 RepID=UPI00389087D1